MKILFYSPVKDVNLFERVGFYRDDINALSLKGDEVIVTNRLLKLLFVKPEMIVGYFYSKALFAAILGRIIRAEVILTGGADQISPVLVSGFNLLKNRVFAFFCLVFAHRILLSCNDDVVNFNILSFGIRCLRKKIELVNHVVIPVCTPEEKKITNKGKFDAITLCWMGSEGNAIRKGVDTSIELIARLRQNKIDARLKIAGSDGPARFFIEQLINKYNISDYVTFLGPISEEDKRKHFLEANIYLQLSLHEGFGVAAAEAFFSGMTVIHSNKGGLKDVIGEKGIVFDHKVFASDDEIKLFYRNVLNYNLDSDSLKNELLNYSIQARSNAFFLGRGNVQK